MSMVTDLMQILPEDRIKARLIDRHSYARDASFYRLVPRVVVQPINEEEIAGLFNYARKTGIPMVFRAAGTSLSGQSITDGILVEASTHWRDLYLDESRGIVHLEPGIIGGQVNRKLAPHGLKIGPDPASLDACMVGGIIANNASGMCCGVKDNSYHTVDSIRVVLPSGLVIDTAEENADDELLQQAPEIHTGLLKLRERILNDQVLRDRIRDKYTRKNTMGYSLNAFIDFHRAVDILAHVMVGSEGTLGFISKVRMKTLPDDPFKSTALLLFENIRAATETVIPLQNAGAEALELMDRAALRSVQDQKGMPQELKTLPEDAAALLCEFQAVSRADLAEKVASGLQCLSTAKLVHPPQFTEDELTRTLYWKIRKGLFPAVGAVRKSGTTVIIEDICFRLKDLADATMELQGLFKKHGYDEAIIFGHAKDGNLHFVISQAFADSEGLAQYERFMNDVIAMTAGKYDGALKAEHGTGRNMAPFLETEWGPEALEIMRELKALFDPENILNPGVILNEDPEIHLKNIKPTPTIEDVVDKCIECGFCETWCPSKDLTMSPRRRIATWREIQLLKNGDFTDRETSRSLLRDYAYESVDTCAVDGLCALGCPVQIDTGELTRHFRQQRHGLLGERIAGWTVRHFSLIVGSVRWGLRLTTPVVRLLGSAWITKFSRILYQISRGKMPAWNRYMPSGGRGLPRLPHGSEATSEEVVYFVSCLNRGMDRIPGETHKLSTSEAFIRLLEKGGIRPIYPEHMASLCCGTPYSSKGYTDAYRQMAQQVVESLWKTTREGELAVVVDTSPCTYKMLHYDDILDGDYLRKWQGLTIIDIVEYLHDTLLPRFELDIQPGKAILHPTCSTRKMGLEDKMLNVAAACSEEAFIPENTGCCGFAGDRGFLVPELTESATRLEAEEVKLHTATGHYSSSRTCEVGMSSATDRSYSSLVHLVYRAVCEDEN